MASKLYIGGLSYQTTQEGLQDHFSQAGTVTSSVVIKDRMTNRSKGFGFVEFSTPEEAQAAIAMFDGKEFDGRTIRVSEARPMEDRPKRS